MLFSISFFSSKISISSSISFSSIISSITVSSSISFFGMDSLTLSVTVFVTLITSLVTSTVEHPQTNNDNVRNKNIRIALMINCIYVIYL